MATKGTDVESAGTINAGSSITTEDRERTTGIAEKTIQEKSEEKVQDNNVEKATKTPDPENVESMGDTPGKTAGSTHTTKGRGAMHSICRWQRYF